MFNNVTKYKFSLIICTHIKNLVQCRYCTISGVKMKKILIVDDEQDIVESLKFVLELSGYTCFCAFNGEDGLKMVKEIVPDLIILDVMMPKINGFKISRLLKFDKKYQGIPIIMLTARSQADDKLIGEETGVNEYITKPFDIDNVVATVNKYLGGIHAGSNK